MIKSLFLSQNLVQKLENIKIARWKNLDGRFLYQWLIYFLSAG